MARFPLATAALPVPAIRPREWAGAGRRSAWSSGRVAGARVAAAVETIELADGRTLCARRWPGSGTGSEETLVLLHGLLDSSEGWQALAGHVTAPRVAFDLPGFGHSDVPARGSVEGYAHDIAAGLEALGIDRFHLVGHSLGGAVAAALAEMLPDRTLSLLLLAPAGFGRIHLAEAVSVPGVREIVQTALPLALSSRLAVTASYLTVITNGCLPDTAVVDRVTSRGPALVAGAREGTRAVVEAGRAANAFHRRRVGYDGPVLAIWGARDHVVPSMHRRGVLTAFPQATVDVWSDMGHHPMRERFDDLVRVLAWTTAAPQRASLAS